MSAHVLSNLLNELEKRDKMRCLPSSYLFFFFFFFFATSLKKNKLGSAVAQW